MVDPPPPTTDDPSIRKEIKDPIQDKEKQGHTSLRPTHTRSSQSSTTVVTPNEHIIQNAHIHSIEELRDALDTDLDQGLSTQEAESRLSKYGENTFGKTNKTSAFSVLLRQLANALTLVLIGVMALSFGVQDWVEGGVICAIILINIVVGFIQEYKANKTLENLQNLASPSATVIRSGQKQEIAAKNVVPGDVVVFQAGSVVPADARLAMVSNVEMNEMILTGESLPVAKITAQLPEHAVDVGAGDRLCVIFSSSSCVKGRGKAVVFATGSRTQIGSIAASLGKESSNQDKGFFATLFDKVLNWLGLRGGTPLQQKMARLAYLLLLIAVLLAIVVFATAKFQVDNELVLYAIALGIGVLPESLLAVLTITFALGTQRMKDQHVIVRKLDSLEALGGISDICSDKTGTITTGKMSMRQIFVADLPDAEAEYVLQSTGTQIQDKPAVTRLGSDQVYDHLPDLLAPLISAASLCSTAVVSQSAKDASTLTASGDPTEVAIQVFAHHYGFNRFTLTDTDKSGYSLVTEFAFDSSVKRMSVVYAEGAQEKDSHRLFCVQKGALERVLPTCTTFGPKCKALGENDRNDIINQMSRMAAKGLRILAIASRRIDGHDAPFGKLDRKDIEMEMNFIGLVGLYDPPRPESADAVAACKTASIRVRMLTGDHPATAVAIAQEVGIIGPNPLPHQVFTASDFDKLSDKDVDNLPDLPLVIARCTPQTKVRMIEAGKRRKYYMAMTGDGINDSPALSIAAVGVAMGSGSDVAKGVSDLILLDDNFQSIVAAVSEGRRIFDNIQRFIIALIVGNVSEVILLMIGLAFLDSEGRSVFPLSPLAILWVNMVTASPPALGLANEPASPDVMLRSPHDLAKGVFTWEVIFDILFYGAASGISCLAVFVILVYGAGGGNLGIDCNETSEFCAPSVLEARSAVFLLLTFHLLFICWEMKSLKRSMFNLTPTNRWYKDLWQNQVLFWSVLIGFGICFVCIYTPTFNRVVFRHEAISWQIGVALGFCALYIILVEAWKAVMHRRNGYAWCSTKFFKKASAGPEPSDAQV